MLAFCKGALALIRRGCTQSEECSLPRQDQESERAQVLSNEPHRGSKSIGDVFVATAILQMWHSFDLQVDYCVGVSLTIELLEINLEGDTAHPLQFILN